MSIIVTLLHKVLSDSITSKKNKEHEIAMINLEIKHLENILAKYEREENGEEVIS